MTAESDAIDALTALLDTRLTEIKTSIDNLTTATGGVESSIDDIAGDINQFVTAFGPLDTNQTALVNIQLLREEFTQFQADFAAVFAALSDPDDLKHFKDVQDLRNDVRDGFTLSLDSMRRAKIDTRGISREVEDRDD